MTIAREPGDRTLLLSIDGHDGGTAVWRDGAIVGWDKPWFGGGAVRRGIEAAIAARRTSFEEPTGQPPEAGPPNLWTWRFDRWDGPTHPDDAPPPDPRHAHTLAIEFYPESTRATPRHWVAVTFEDAAFAASIRALAVVGAPAGLLALTSHDLRTAVVLDTLTPYAQDVLVQGPHVADIRHPGGAFRVPVLVARQDYDERVLSPAAAELLGAGPEGLAGLHPGAGQPVASAAVAELLRFGFVHDDRTAYRLTREGVSSHARLTAYATPAH